MELRGLTQLNKMEFHFNLIEATQFFSHLLDSKFQDLILYSELFFRVSRPFLLKYVELPL